MSVDFPLPLVWLQERHTSGGWKSLRDELTMRLAVLADSRSGNFPLFSRLIPCVKPTNIFTLGWIQHLESARCHRGAAKFGDQVNPDIRPRRKPENGDARRDRWVKRSTGDVA